MEYEYMLSVYCTIYNHEKYLEKALDSVLMQESSYSYEVLVGEDCSTDNSRAILKAYEEKHPGKLKVFYRTHNMNHEIINNGKDLRHRCRGKYIILIEGDDYWTDKNKLQKQIDFLENNPDYLACAHNCVIVDENNKPNGEQFYECKDNEYTLDHYKRGIMPGQTTTLMSRNYTLDNLFNTSFIESAARPGDRKIYFSIICNGRIWCIQEKMSAYRHITNTGSSYSAKYKRSYEKLYEWNREQYVYANQVNNKQAIECAGFLLIKTIKEGVRMGDISCIKGFFQIVVVKNWWKFLFNNTTGVNSQNDDTIKMI